eukprot:c10222_g1_i2.p1 GENE.c10222_g1_i2~~c10222_g1_i2.p1  ORF type:complete len:205 (+),score=39.25 c10222_g1_i2:55-669(+)
MAKRGLSMDDKKTNLLKLFHESSDVFTLKELEKVCQGKCGISSMQVKEILQMIQDENWVESEKVGINMVYWSFPSQAAVQKQNKRQKLRQDHEELSAKLASAEETLRASMVGKEESGDREVLMQQLATLESENATLKTEVAKYAANDPEKLEQLRREIDEAKEAATRWTDNLWMLRKHCADKFNIEGPNFDQMAGERFEDYIEE